MCVRGSVKPGQIRLLKAKSSRLYRNKAGREKSNTRQEDGLHSGYCNKERPISEDQNVSTVCFCLQLLGEGKESNKLQMS